MSLARIKSPIEIEIELNKIFLKFDLFNYNFSCDVFENQSLQVMNIVANLNMFGSKYWNQLLKQGIILSTQFPVDMRMYIEANIKTWDRELRLSNLLDKDELSGHNFNDSEVDES